MLLCIIYLQYNVVHNLCFRHNDSFANDARVHLHTTCGLYNYAFLALTHCDSCSRMWIYHPLLKVDNWGSIDCFVSVVLLGKATVSDVSTKYIHVYTHRYCQIVSCALRRLYVCMCGGEANGERLYL